MKTGRALALIAMVAALQRAPAAVVSPNDGRVLDGRACAAFSTDGKRLAAGSGNPPGIKIWDCESGRELLSLGGRGSQEQRPPVQGFPIGFSHVVFTPDDQRLVTAGLFLAQGLATWDATSGQMLGTFGTNLLAPGSGTGPFDPRVNGQPRFVRLTLSPDGKLVYAVACDYGRSGVPGAVGCWNTTSGELQFSIHESSSTLRSLVFSPDGKHLAAYLVAVGMAMYADAGKRETGIAVWDALSGQRKYTLQVRSREVFGPRMAFSADGKRLSVFAGGRPSQPGATGQPDAPADLRLWQVESGRETSPIPLEDVKAGSCQQVLFSPDSKVIALVLNGRQVSLLEASTGKLLRTLDSATAVHQVVFSRDGKLLAAGCGEPNEILGSTGDVKLWTVANGKLAKHFQGQRGYASEVRFSPDGKRLLSLNEVSMVLWTLPAELAVASPAQR